MSFYDHDTEGGRGVDFIKKCNSRICKWLFLHKSHSCHALIHGSYLVGSVKYLGLELDLESLFNFCNMHGHVIFVLFRLVRRAKQELF